MGSIKLVIDVPGPYRGALVMRRAVTVSASVAQLAIATGKGSAVMDEAFATTTLLRSAA